VVLFIALIDFDFLLLEPTVWIQGGAYYTSDLNTYCANNRVPNGDVGTSPVI